MVEEVDRRVLAAVQFVHPATGALVTDGLTVTSSATFRRNWSGRWVLWPEGVLDTHARQFEAAPAAPAAGSVTVQGEVTDEKRRFADRAFSVAVPRVGNDLFTPIEVIMPAAPALSLRLTWARVFVSVTYATDGSHPTPDPIQGALVRLDSTDLGGLRGIGLTNVRGEGLVVGPRIPRTAPSMVDDGTVIRPATTHTVTVVVDRAATEDDGRRTTLADPDDLWSRRASLAEVSATVDLTAGAVASLSFTIPRS